MKRKWSEYQWPSWVPQFVRDQVESFWSNEWGRDYIDWQKSCAAAYNYQPPLGAMVHVNRRAGWRGRKVRVGRWIPTWNNMGRILLCDGSCPVVSTCDIIQGEREKWKARKLKPTPQGSTLETSAVA